MNQILIQNVSLFSENHLISQKNVLIENSIIKSIESIEKEIQIINTCEIINGSHFLLLPGLMNSHSHIPMVLFRGLAEDLTLHDWLHDKIFPLESKLNAELVYFSSLLGIAELIHSGCTFFADMYFFMEEVAKAVSLSGIRANLSLGLIDKNGDKGIDEAISFFQNYHQSSEGRIQVFFGPHAPYTCNISYLQKISKLAKSLKTGIHIHLNETQSEISNFEMEHKVKPIEALERAEFFGTPMICAHCVHVTLEEINILRKNNVLVAHNPSSNMKLASGAAPVIQMLKQGIPVSLGTDGAASNNQQNLFQEMHLASLLGKLRENDCTALPADLTLDMATRIPGDYLFHGKLGQISPGSIADLILIDYAKTNLTPETNLNKSFLHAMQGNEVDTVIVNGKIIMKNQKILTFNEIDIREKINDLARRYLS